MYDLEKTIIRVNWVVRAPRALARRSERKTMSVYSAGGSLLAAVGTKPGLTC